MMMSLKCYSELIHLTTFEERYEYLRLGGGVGIATFGFDRYINQAFYTSSEWKSARRFVIARDRGCDLGIDGYELENGLLVHHINPMDADDILNFEEWILNPEYLITTSQKTHNAIHYGDRSLLPKPYAPRASGDTKLW
jgi:hypothetical protein